MLSVLPLSRVIVDLRRISGRDPANAVVALGYILTVLAAAPIVWAFAGAFAVLGWDKVSVSEVLQGDDQKNKQAAECGNPDDMAVLSGLATGVVAAPSNSGAEILRFTQHRALSGPYHRNQRGMLTELHIGLSQPEEAKAFLRGAGVTILAFCKTDPQTVALIQMKSDGLYAGLARGEVPAYLQPVGAASDDGFRIFRVLPDKL